jgi:Protein of unknown function (DUF1822)
MNNIDTQLLTFTVVFTNDTHALAQQCVSGITNPVKAKQVYVNTLAVYAVDYYLRCMGFDPDWLHSASRNPLLAKLMNVADLVIKDIGKIECIPVSADRVECDIPPESENECVGYIPVQINEAQTEATILGFSTQTSGTIKLDRLADLEYAIEYLTNLEQPAIVKLREWLNGLVDGSWETLDRVLNPAQQRLFYRGTVNRGQKIDLFTPTVIRSLALVVDVKSTDISQEVDILIQVCPTDQNELPDGIKLAVGDDTETIMTAISRSGDNWIQLNFTAMFDEKFTVIVSSQETEVRKKFAV